MIGRRLLTLAAAGLLAPPARAVLPDPARPVPFPPAGRRAWADALPMLRLGMLGGGNDVDSLGRYDSYRALLETTYQIPVQLRAAADYGGVIQAFAGRAIELATMTAAAYAGAWLETAGNVLPLVVAVDSDGSIGSRAAMVARADSGIDSLAQMRGHSLAWADPSSISGYLIPRLELRRQGIDTGPGGYFGRTGFGGGHERAIMAVLRGQYDATVTWISGVGDPAQGYTRGNLHELITTGAIRPGALKVIWTSPPILNGPVAIRGDTPDPFRADMLAFHLALPAARPDVFRRIQLGGGIGFRAVRAEDFEPFIDLRRDEALRRGRP